MKQDNPMLGQLQAEYEGNPHFAAMADEVAREIICCGFAEGMNAHPDVMCEEGRWIGTIKRLVCNAIFKMYTAGPPGKPFDPKLFLRAKREMEPYTSQVQGFRYEHPESGGHIHVVKDFTHPTKQRVWEMVEDRSAMEKSEEAAKAEYDRCHSAMMDAIEERQIQMVWVHYLWGTISGEFFK